MLIRSATAFALSLTLTVLTGCGASLPDPPPPGADDGNKAAHSEPGPDLDAAVEAVERFVEAKRSRDFGRMWDLSHSAYRELVVAIGRPVATRDRSAAVSQGFQSTDEARAVSDREYFIRSRTAQAKRKQLVYPEGVLVRSTRMRQPIMVPFPSKRVRVYPVRVQLSDGTRDVLGAATEGGKWRIVSEFHTQIGQKPPRPR